jgi:hypothetical protein
MPTFNYHGSFNEQEVKGAGGLCSSEETGNLQGGIDFSDSQDPSFVNYAATTAGMSILSISCANKNKAESGASNIIGLSKGNYVSERIVEVWDGNEQIGQVNITGSFRKIKGKVYAGTVNLSGFYSSSKLPKLFEGYQLKLTPEGSNKLIGGFEKEIETKEGENLLVKHTQKYNFLEGTTKELQELMFELTIDQTNSFVDGYQGFVYLVGNSRIYPAQ